jgi:hypothetical protein
MGDGRQPLPGRGIVMPTKRQVLAEQLLDLQLKIADDVLRVDELKERLRAHCINDGEGFVEGIAGKRSVEVEAGVEAKLKGLLPEFKPEAFLKLPAASS